MMKKLLLGLSLCAVAWAQNPVVRLSYVVPFSGQAATGTATSSAIRIPNLSGYGTLTVTSSGISGSPSGCQIALAYEQSGVAIASSAFDTQAITLDNAYHSYSINPAAGFAGGDTLVATFSCSVYPGAGGTLTATFDPNTPVTVLNTVQTSESGNWFMRLQDGSGNTVNSTSNALNSYITNWPVTQPISGTITANIGATNGLALDSSVTGLQVAQGSTTSGQKGSLAQGAVATSAPSYATGQTSPLSLTVAGALRVDGSNSTQPISGTVTTNPPSNASTNVAQFGGSNVVTGAGASGAGIPRVTISNDSSLAANQSVNVNQIGGSNVSTAASGVQKVGVVGNAGAAFDQAPGSAAPANAVQTGGTDGTSLRVPYMDPCSYSAWTYYPINSSANVQVAAGATSKYFYVCELFVAPAQAAITVGLVGSATSGNACATSPNGLMGGSTTGTVASVAANGGWVLPPSNRAWMKSVNSGDALCVSTSGQVSGVMAYVQQ